MRTVISILVSRIAIASSCFTVITRPMFVAASATSCAGSPTRRDGKVVYIYRQCTEAGNADAVSAARGAVAAGQQDQFWVMHQLLLRRGQKFAADDIDQLAQEIDLDIAQFEQDVATARVETHLAEDRELAEQVGIICTPALFIESNPYSGAWDE